jgi:hypothetical protein
MSETGELILVGVFSLLVLGLSWKLQAVLGASRDENPVAFWMTIGTLAFGSIACFAFAIWSGVQ